MYLSKAAYYSDFVVFPIILLILATSLFFTGTRHEEMLWAIACGAGLAGYSLLEYGLHRYVLHQIPPFSRMHALHHEHPAAMVGTPTWMTAAFGIGVLLVTWWLAGWAIGCGISFGLMAGYLWYGLMHHAVHHWKARKGSYLDWLKRRHHLHHYARQACNYGVTTALWDRMFGSERGTTRA